ncbi:hypothetical protein ONZ45_g1942 [Pleurotus djamor]|nr:hypothetical protein ONZ45_g1942 [Pleurotus djamor]
MFAPKPLLLRFLIRALSPEPAEGTGSTPTPPKPHLIAAFNAVQITGLVLLLLVILTSWLSPKVKRSIPWYNIIISWIFSAFSFLLIIGKQTGPEPPFGLCLLQSIFIYAAPSMLVISHLISSTCSNLFLPPGTLVSACASLWSVSSATNRQSASRKWRFFIIFLPYIVPALVIIEALALGLTHRQTVKRTLDGMYCHLEMPTPSLITGGIVVFVMIAVLPVVGVTTYMFIRNWNAFRQMRVRETGGVPPRMVIRFGIFCLLPLPIVTISLVSINFRDGGPQSAEIQVGIATLPIVAALIFGTQTDILSVWMFWRWRPKRPQAHVVQVSPPPKQRLEDIEMDIKGARKGNQTYD